ncbi:MAG: hypothetical protein KDA65_18310 [Planctomycetaceae bacterium]|nr:hypothetical protein [Planctomycetaceae bacterium]
MNRLFQIAAVTFFSFTAIGCCCCGPVCDPCGGYNYGNYGGGCCLFGGPGSIFDSCCTSGCGNSCYDPCCGPVMSAGPVYGGGDCCTTSSTAWQAGPSYSSSAPMSHSPGPHLSVPTPAGVTSGPVSYHSYGHETSSGLKISSHPESSGPVYQQSSNSPWIRAGY